MTTNEDANALYTKRLLVSEELRDQKNQRNRACFPHNTILTGASSFIVKLCGVISL